MKTYWDSSALIAALQSPEIRARVEKSKSLTRSHSLSEVFSTMTGGRLGFRCDADDVAKMIRQLVADIEIVDLTPSKMLRCIDQAKSKGIRGGAVYDYLHACTAIEKNCKTVLTLNLSDFRGLFEELHLEEP